MIFYIFPAYACFSEFYWLDVFRHISTFAVERSSTDVEESDAQAQELLTFSSGQTLVSRTSSNDCASSSGYHGTYTESSSPESDSPSVNGGTTSTSTGDSSQIRSTLVQSDHSGQSGISIFQGY